MLGVDSGLFGRFYSFGVRARDCKDRWLEEVGLR